jgi:flagellar basal body-associated protein FliL
MDPVLQSEPQKANHSLQILLIVLTLLVLVFALLLLATKAVSKTAIPQSKSASEGASFQNPFAQEPSPSAFSTAYQNPFDETGNQYTNPFADLK